MQCGVVAQRQHRSSRSRWVRPFQLAGILALCCCCCWTAVVLADPSMINGNVVARQQRDAAIQESNNLYHYSNLSKKEKRAASTSTRRITKRNHKNNNRYNNNKNNSRKRQEQQQPSPVDKETQEGRLNKDGSLADHLVAPAAAALVSSGQAQEEEGNEKEALILLPAFSGETQAQLRKQPQLQQQSVGSKVDSNNVSSGINKTPSTLARGTQEQQQQQKQAQFQAQQVQQAQFLEQQQQQQARRVQVIPSPELSVFDLRLSIKDQLMLPLLSGAPPLLVVTNVSKDNDNSQQDTDDNSNDDDGNENENENIGNMIHYDEAAYKEQLRLLSNERTKAYLQQLGIDRKSFKDSFYAGPDVDEKDKKKKEKEKKKNNNDDDDDDYYDDDDDDEDYDEDDDWDEDDEDDEDYDDVEDYDNAYNEKSRLEQPTLVNTASGTNREKSNNIEHHVRLPWETSTDNSVVTGVDHAEVIRNPKDSDDYDFWIPNDDDENLLRLDAFVEAAKNDNDHDDAHGNKNDHRVPKSVQKIQLGSGNIIQGAVESIEDALFETNEAIVDTNIQEIEQSNVIDNADPFAVNSGGAAANNRNGNSHREFMEQSSPDSEEMTVEDVMESDEDMFRKDVTLGDGEYDLQSAQEGREAKESKEEQGEFSTFSIPHSAALLSAQWEQLHGGLNPNHGTHQKSDFSAMSKSATKQPKYRHYPNQAGPDKEQDYDKDGTLSPDVYSRQPYSILVQPSNKTLPQTSPLTYLAYNKHGDRIMDFSMVGWNEGNTPFPHFSTIYTLRTVQPSETEDDTLRIQADLDFVGTMTQGKSLDSKAKGIPSGALYLQAGEYRLKSPLKMKYGGVLLRGDPEGGTKILCMWEATGEKYAVEVEGESDEKLTDTRVPIVADYVPVGSFVIPLDPDYLPDSGLTIGDQIIVNRVGNLRWVKDMGMDDFDTDKENVKPWGKMNGEMYREIRGLDLESGILTMDAPLPVSISRKYGGGFVTKIKDNKIRNIGIQDLDFIFPDNVGKTMQDMLDPKGRGSDDYRFSYGIFANYVIRMDKVQNAYITRVTSTYFHNFLSLGREVHHITVDSVVHVYPEDLLSGQSAFQLSGQLTLIQRTLSQGSFHFFVDISHVMGPNVVHRSEATNVGSAGQAMNMNFAPGDVGPHAKFCTGLLFDQIATDGSLSIVNRGSMGTGQGYAGANSVIWNSRAREGVLTHRPAGTQNFVIGSEDYEAADGQDWDSHGWREHLGSEVEPESLYLRQLRDRQKRMKQGWVA